LVMDGVSKFFSSAIISSLLMGRGPLGGFFSYRLSA
jgi:hypothetical protein